MPAGWRFVKRWPGVKPLERARPSLARLPQVTLREQVANAIRDAILLGRLRPGDKIPEQQLAAELGVSRVPVREAIRILEQQGILITRPKSGTYIARLTPDELEDGMRVRAALEQFALEQALARSTPDEWAGLCDRLEGLLGQMAALAGRAEWARVTEADTAWHTLIVDAARNQVLSQFWRQLGLPVRLMALSRSQSDPTPERYRRTIADHAAMLAVLRGRDVAECRQAVGEHVLRHALA